MYAVVVEFMIKPERFDEFLTIVRQNADTSLQTEPGCTRFDVLWDPARPGDVLLYELYSTAAAFDLHLQTPHFKSFDTLSAEMVTRKTVRTYGEVHP